MALSGSNPTLGIFPEHTHGEKAIDDVWLNRNQTNSYNSVLAEVVRLFPQRNCALMTTTTDGNRVVPCDMATMLLWRAGENPLRFVSCFGDHDGPIMEIHFNPGPNVEPGRRFEVTLKGEKGPVYHSGTYAEAGKITDQILKTLRGAKS